MTALNPIALNPIGLQFLNPIASGLAAASNAPQLGSDSSFLSFLNDVATELPTGSDTAFSDIPQRVTNRKQADPLSTALLNVPVLPAMKESTPLPTRLSLNLFRQKPEAKVKEPLSTAVPTANDANVATVDMLSFTNLIPLTAAENPTNFGSRTPAVENTPTVSIPDLPAAQGLPVHPDDDFAKSGAPRVNADAHPENSTAAPHLAFALRLNPVDQPTGEAPVAEAPTTIEPASPAIARAVSVVPEVTQHDLQTAKPVEPVAGTGVVATPASAPQASSGGSNTETNSGNHRPANRQNDADPNTVPATSAPAAASATPVHSMPGIGSQATAPQATPAAPSPTREVSISQHVTSTPAVAEAPKTGPANQLSFSVSGNDQQKVEVRVMDRAGEVHVSVRTPNEELASTLRSDLGSLTGKLTQSGYTTEAFTPATHGGELSQQNSAQQQRNSADQQNPGQQHTGGQGRNSHRHGQQQGQQQDSQQNGRYKRPAWLDELENSLAHAPASKRINVQ